MKDVTEPHTLNRRQALASTIPDQSRDDELLPQAFEVRTGRNPFFDRTASAQMSGTTDGDKAQETKPWGDASRSLANQIEAGSKECMSCRIVGSGTFAGVGIYALMQARASAPGTPGQKRIIGGLGVGACTIDFVET
ncbi:hypothetical protein NP233_g4928 [Leucocoprinus birnbaumii]|uniref:Distal membrane-arm assembly complex protein 1-like domain-containing protein n=1 Tax=Leucocoprinus birnbaumii TaxID=56174 RepID=A0AAD5YWU8_9AGAR|nr:hypothetical protein NP233_g4928 [Leucocoprinus birnbaumii]